MFPSSYLVVSHLQMLKHRLEQKSLAWQPSRVDPTSSRESQLEDVDCERITGQRILTDAYNMYTFERVHSLLKCKLPTFFSGV